MRECPNCGYVDPPYWRNRLFDYEVDICKMEDLEQIDSELASVLRESSPGITIQKGVYTYRRTRTDWIYRIWTSLFKVRGWHPEKYYDGACSKASTLRKQNLRAYSNNRHPDKTPIQQQLLELP